MVDEMPNAVAIPSNTGKEIRPRKVIRALSLFLCLTVKRLQARPDGGGDVRHRQHVTRPKEDAADPKAIAGTPVSSEDACRGDT